MKRTAALAAAALALAVCALFAAAEEQPAAPKPAPAAATTGSVQGVIKYAGKAAKPAPIKPTKDPAVCGARPLFDESLLVGKGGGLANAVIWLDRVPGARAPVPAQARVDQVACRYVPHVMAVPVGSDVTLGNSDKTLHNVHAYQDDDTLFNVALPSVGTKSKQKLEEPGVVTLKCDAGHTWMRAYVATFDHPYYAVTDKNGNFTIAGVPPGKHAVKVWHEKLGNPTGSIEVKAGEPASLELSMGAK